MNDLEIRASAMLNEAMGQRNSALDRCVALQADIAALKAQIAELKKPKEEAPKDTE